MMKCRHTSPRIYRWLACLCGILFIVNPTANLLASGYSRDQPTLAQIAADSKFVILIKWFKADVGDEVQLEPGKPKVKTFVDTYEIVDVLKDETGTYKKGQSLQQTRYDEEKPTLLGYWVEKCGSPIDTSPRGFTYLKGMPSTKAPPQEQLAYYFKFLESKDDDVAEDARLSFLWSEPADSKALSETVETERLRELISSTDTRMLNRSIYGVLLGYCGKQEDAKFLEQIIFAEMDPRELRPDLDGLIAGYVLIEKEAALDRIDATIIKHEGKVPTSKHISVLMAIRFLHHAKPDSLAQERLLETARLFLDNLNMVEHVLPDLIRWKDWRAQQQVASLYSAEKFHAPAIKREIILYQFAAMESVPAETQVVPDYVVRAKSFLELAKMTDPELFKQTQKLHQRYGPQPAAH